MQIMNSNGVEFDSDIRRVEAGWDQCRSLLQVANGDKRVEQEHENVRKWHKVVNEATKKRKRTLSMIDASLDVPDMSNDRGYWKWIKRFLGIGNIGVILVCCCLLIASSVVCFRK